MNTTALKSFAPTVRRQLMEAVARKLDFVLSAQTPDYLTTYATQVDSLRNLEHADRPGLIERVAYTWFNRLTALRYLDARGWHPFRARVLTPASPDETQPELLKLTRTGALPDELRRHTDPGRINDILDGHIPSPAPQGEVYRHLILAACRFYNALLPNLFEKLDDETELLLPDDLLSEHSVAHGFRSEITDFDCAAVEILGWLYQFYISEKKEVVMGRKAAVPADDIPAVTQLFTPHWIVRYLVENSLGRLWLLNRPSSRLPDQMPYYIEGETETAFLRITKPEEIRLLDPAVGSGHMLAYAFDLLFAIYEEEGYASSDIPGLILTHNLYGVDICPRAAQLAALALVLKAREKSQRFFHLDRLVQPRIVCLADVSFGEGELSEYIRALDLGDLFNRPMIKLLNQFEQATTFGSLIEPCLDEAAIARARRIIESQEIRSQLFVHETHTKVLRVLEQAEALTSRYRVIVTNPPYIGSKGMNANLKAFMAKHYDDYKTDLFAAFVVRCISMAQENGKLGLMTPFVWMFLSSYEPLRHLLLNTTSITSLIHPEYHAFFESAYVPICAFTVSKAKSQSRGVFIRLTDFYGEELQQTKALEAIANPECGWSFRASAEDFQKVPGCPIAYWISARFAGAFARFSSVSEIGDTRIGLITGENSRYIRFWYEVTLTRIGFGLSRKDASQSGCRWFPQSKGGDFRRWYGNHETVVDWSNDGHELVTRLHASGERTLAHNFNLDKIFLPAITWTKISSGSFSARLQPTGFLFNDASANLFIEHDNSLHRALAFLNSELCMKFLQALNPTLNFLPGNISTLPLPQTFGVAIDRELVEIAQIAVGLARTDWDNFETSWDFFELPLLRQGLKAPTLEASWQNWKVKCDAAILRMQELETKNNRLLIAAYGLQEELSPSVLEGQITLARANARKDMAAFLSYAVGCMMGRFSLDQPGLIMADAGDTVANYLTKLGKSVDDLSFVVDEDGIIPVLDGEWFEDDIVARFRSFLRVTFGDSTLRENVRFIEESLGKDLRKYFFADFYKDHLQIYKKRPIYWLIQSPRKGFSVLIYLHRYTRDTMNLVLNRYLREYQAKLRSRLAHLAHTQTNDATSARDKTAARKEADKLTKTLRECEEWERDTLLPLAQARIELDLDDGVKTNYLRLGEALAPIPGLAAAEE